ncbi:MAG: hypothetical protein P0116_02670 [Candidatus Nitrosocosmicus sp.]|nr:hypothetical protein [Candidatus Nitrosocosmicus sp.]
MTPQNLVFERVVTNERWVESQYHSVTIIVFYNNEGILDSGNNKTLRRIW